jgi:hypothetical protein
VDLEIEDPKTALKRMEAERSNVGISKPISPEARKRFLETLGRTCGKLTVVAYAAFHKRPDGTGGAPVWTCRCTCGRTKLIHSNNLHVKDGATRGCGSCSGRELGAPLDELTLRLLALGLESEGALGVYVSETEHVNGRRYPLCAARLTIGIAVVGRPLLQQVIAEVGMGALHRHGAGGERRNASVQLQLNNDDAIHLARQIEPYLLTKYPQARLVRQFPASGRGRKLPAQIITLRDQLVAETACWNAKGAGAPIAPEADKRAARWIDDLGRLRYEDRDRLLARVSSTSRAPS